jgi:hypothetical protein
MYQDLDTLCHSASLNSTAYSDYNETYIYGMDGSCTEVYSSGAYVTFNCGAYDGSKSSTDKSISNRKDSDGFKAD